MLIPKTVRTFFPFAVAVSIASAAASSLTEMTVHGWYLRLARPLWSAPPRLFGPVWTILYAAMALAAWRVYNSSGWPAAQKPLILWGIQLVLNAFWPGFFFALKSPRLGSFEIILTLGFIIATALAFWRRDRTAGLLLLPPCGWGAYITALSVTIWHMNR